MIQFHKEVADLAGNKPALAFSNEAFRGFLLNNFLKTLELAGSDGAPVDGFPLITLRFLGLDVEPAQFQIKLTDRAGSIICEVTPPFTAQFSLHVTGQPKLEFSRLAIDVADLRVTITVSAPLLSLGTPDYSARGSIQESPSRADAIAAGISEQDISRIEAALAFVLPRRIVNSAFSTISSLNLADHFTALELSGTWAVSLVSDGLVIIPSGGVYLTPNKECPVGGVPDLEITPGVMTNPKKGEYSWSLSSKGGGPVVHRANDHSRGFASLYAPKSLWEQRFSKVMPGFLYREQGNGFIGYNLAFNCGFEYIALSIDPARYGIVIALQLLVDGTVFANIDVPCVGRMDLAYARFGIEKSNLSILIGFDLSGDGQLQLKGSIDKLDIGKCEATVSLFGRWLALAGGEAAVIGFIIDYVLKRVVEHNVPIKIRHAVEKEVNEKNFTLLDLGTLRHYTRYHVFNEVSYSGDASSTLVGLASEG